VSDADGDPLTYAWDFGDGSTSREAQPTHTYTTAGLHTVRVTVTDGSVVAEGTTQVEVNTRPRIDAGPTATPAIAMQGNEIAFAVAASDDDGDTLTYVWSFGDGDTGTGAAVKHTYANSGDYTVTVDVTDGFATTRGTVQVEVAKPLALTKLRGGVNFRKAGRDKLDLKCDLDLPADFDPEGKVLAVDVGGVELSLILDRKGKARSIAGSAKLKFKKKLGRWSLAVKLKKGTFADRWQDDGVVDGTLKAVPISFDCRIRVEDRPFHARGTVAYTGKAGKAGKFK
jgi:chitodextrinase